MTTKLLLNPATRAVTKTHLLKMGALLCLILGTYFLVQQTNVEEFLKPERVAARLNSAGLFAPLVFIMLMASAVVISPIPSLPLDLAAGITFGAIAGTAYAVIGAEIGAIISFLIGRALGREALTRLLRTEIRFCERCSDRHLAIFVFLSRLVPVISFDLVSYGAGLTNMSLITFAVATFLGMIVPTFALVSAGTSLIAGKWVLVILGLGMVALFLVMPRFVYRYQSSWWVRLLRGESPISVGPQSVPGKPRNELGAPVSRCSLCDGPLE